MTDAEYYRQEAQRCRQSATQSPKPAMKDLWLKLAKEYDQLAADVPVIRQTSPMPEQPEPGKPQQQGKKN